MQTDFNFLLAFLTGIAGAFHCMGMCGGFASGYFVGHGWRERVKPQLLYHVSRIGVYVVLAVVGAQLGKTLVQTGATGKVQGVVFMVSGLFIILTGFWMMRKHWRAITGSAVFSQIVPFGERQPAARVLPGVVGLLNGFVPCSLLFSVMLKAVAGGDPLHAGILMLSFGLGTLPAMLLVTQVGAIAGEKTRGFLGLFLGVVVVGFGLWTFYQGWFFFDVMRGLVN